MFAMIFKSYILFTKHLKNPTKLQSYTVRVNSNLTLNYYVI